MEKMCSRCRKVKDISEFAPIRKKYKNHIYHYTKVYCRDCERKYKQEYRNKLYTNRIKNLTLDEAIEIQKEYVQFHKQCLLTRSMELLTQYIENKEK